MKQVGKPPALISREHTFLLRFIAVIGILVQHFFSAYIDVIRAEGAPASSFMAAAFILNAAKFATLFFFLISGYCFQLNARQYYQKSIGTFLGKKWLSLGKPYVVLFFIPVVLLTVFVAPYIGVQQFEVSPMNVLVRIFQEVFLTNYWFIPVLFLYFGVNYYIRSVRTINLLIWVSLICTLFYSVNVYTAWFPYTAHSLAFPGFLFFFLLGRKLAIDRLPNILANTGFLAALAFIAYCCSGLETYLLHYRVGTTDSFNTLRCSNLVYALSMFFLLVKLLKGSGVSASLQQVNTYFIYLVHPYVVRLLCFLVANGYFGAYFTLPVALLVTVAGVCGCFMLAKKLLPASRLLSGLMEGKPMQASVISLWTFRGTAHKADVTI